MADRSTTENLSYSFYNNNNSFMKHRSFRATPTRNDRSMKGNKTPKSPAPGADRFIPNRNAALMDQSHYFITQAKSQESIDDSLLQSNISNYSGFIDSLEPSRSILSFSQGNPRSTKPNRSIKKDGTSPRKTARKIPSQPERVLDAPDVMKDYYLQLLDWGSTNFLAVALNQDVYLWNASTGEVKDLLKVQDGEYVSSVSWSKTGQYLSVGISNGDVALWDPVAEKKMRTMKSQTARVNCLSWNAHVVSSGSRSGAVHNHDVRIAAHHVGSFMGHDQQVCGLRWSPNGQHLASGGSDKIVNIWSNTINHDENNQKKLVNSFTEHQGAVKAVSWCPWNPNVIATGGGSADRQIRIWNCTNGASLYNVDTNSQVCDILWSTEYKELISGHGYSALSGSTNNNTEVPPALMIWRYQGLNKVAELTGHTRRILGLSMSPDETTVVSVGADETLRFWECFKVDPTKKKKEERSKDVSANMMGFSGIR